MKYSKELLTGIITVVAIALLVVGVNFMKGNSLFGNDHLYYAYFPNTGGVTPSNPVLVNGVTVGKVVSVDLNETKDSTKLVKMAFTITKKGYLVGEKSVIEAGALGLLDNAVTIYPESAPKSYLKPGGFLQGINTSSMLNQVKGYADPISHQLQAVMGSVKNLSDNVGAFWDEKASSELERTLKTAKTAIYKFGNAADQIEGLISNERIRLARIFSNVESITGNLKQSNEDISSVLGNLKTISDDLVSANFKDVVNDAQKAINSVNEVLVAAQNGENTIGKLLNDDALYNELVRTNKDLQNLVVDFQLHPERYIHFSILGKKQKPMLSPKESMKVREMINDSTNLTPEENVKVRQLINGF